MATMEVTLFGQKMKNPLFTSSGPTSRNSTAIQEAVEGGVGGVFCDTISLKASGQPRPYMQVYTRKSKKSVISAELASETKWEYWVEKEYEAILQHKIPTIASVGYSLEEMKILAPKVESAGVTAIELSTRYIDAGKIVELAKVVRNQVKIPILLKISPEKPNIVNYALQAQEYIDGYVASDAYGGALHLDVETASPHLSGGFGWVFGEALKPISMGIVASLAKSTQKPIIGAGGVSRGEDVIEYFMAGASAVQVGAHALYSGSNSYDKIVKEAIEWLDEHGYKSIEEIKGIALKAIGEEHRRYQMGFPDFNLERCTSCMLCVKTCPYKAIYTMEADRAKTQLHRVRLYPRLDRRICEACGWCASICPSWAITMTEVF